MTSGTAALADACSGAPEVKELTIMADWLPWASQGPMITAQIKGYYADEGLTVKIISPANPADPIKLVARQRVDFSLTYVPEVMLARETGIPVISVAAFMRVLGSGLFYRSDAGISSPADLKGKILGVGPKQDAQAFLATLLASAGLEKKDVKVVDPGYAHVPLVLTEKVAAAHGLTFGEGVVADQELAKQGEPGAKWLLYRDYGVPNFYYMLLVGNEDWIKENDSTTCRFLRATKKATDDWINSPDETLAAIFKGNDLFTLEQHQGIYKESKSHWKASDGTIFHQEVGVWKTAQDWAVAQKLILVPADPASYFTNAYLPAN
jgi:putative hydroxymethylpyrimidine transport system substrate-binding protein